MNEINIGNRIISARHPCFIIAEAGLNHNGEPDLAHQLIDSATECGADAIKFQTYKTKELFPPDHPDYEKFLQTEFSFEVYLELKQHSDENGLVFLSTPFDEDSLELLERLSVPAFKIGSGEVTHIRFLQQIASKKKPVILSTGMSTMGEIQKAVQTIKEHGCGDIVLLHCVSAYPCPPEKANINMMKTLQERFQLPIGYSDHTITDTAAMAAIALGACVVEKHFTLDHELSGWDHFFSYDPKQFKQMVESIRQTEAVLGHAEKGVHAVEKPIHQIARRSIYARRTIERGEIIQEDMLVIRRPVADLQADQTNLILEKKAAKTIPAQTALRLEDVE